MAICELYAAPRGTYGNAFLNWTEHSVDDVMAYAVSYRNAAHNLVAFREQRGVGDIDHAACPIVFLFRHSLELYLKAMIYRAARLSVDDADLPAVLPRLWREHSLVRLLDMATPVLHALDPHIPMGLRGLREELLDLVTKIDHVDPGSYSFRYPVTPGGGASMPKNLLLNIFTFAEHVDTALDHLSQFCVYLLSESISTSAQMKLALSPITAKGNNVT